MVKQTEAVRPGRVQVAAGETTEAVAAKVRPRLSEAAYAEKMLQIGYDENGNQVPDPTVMEPPIGWKEQPSMVELIRTMIREHELERGLEGDYESFDEADDFDVGDENAEELRSGWENDFEPPEVEKIRKSAKGKAKKPQEAPTPAEEDKAE